MSRDEKIVKILKRVLPIMSILTVFVFVMLINKKSYALFHKRIETDIMIHITTADEMPFTPGPANDVVKSTVVSNVTDTCTEPDFNGGLVAINQEGTLYQEDSRQEIREYRYIGPEVNNYIYFNCQDGVEQNESNCEVWRILGIFKDESGEEHIKIVRNNFLTRDIFPATFEANGTTYTIQGRDFAYWNSKGDEFTHYNNDWATAGLQYWLNAGSDKETKTASDGYMSYLSKNAKSMIENTKYYLGNFNSREDTITNYKYERGNTECSGSCSGGDIWSGNQATWNGNIALMYPSDCGYTANSCNWTKSISSSSIMSGSWLQTTANTSSDDEWLLSPSSYYSYRAANWNTGGYIGYYSVNSDLFCVRPTISLKSEVKITGGDGTESSPYEVEVGS